MSRAVYDSPVGRLCVTADGDAITRLNWGGVADGPPTALLAEALDQLAAYFAGTRTVFDLPFRVAGSEFQRAVCDAMLAIPFGATRTYGEIARDLGASAQAVGSPVSAQAVGSHVSAQAVGNACGANPIPLFIPCHRVLGANSLGGYSGAGGIETKVALLRHEGAAGLLL
ncbi:MAG: methylated-DNA--[protein]-cysteine S-methyltransferase [Maritimibacter sp.]|nr:methylated-DNA--[protein]-cysteine S-methyltransferase [Maritimibacter sp.]